MFPLTLRETLFQPAAVSSFLRPFSMASTAGPFFLASRPSGSRKRPFFLSAVMEAKAASPLLSFLFLSILEVAGFSHHRRKSSFFPFF